MSSFLQQWRSYAESTSTELHRGVNASLEALCGTADTLCATLGTEAQALLERDAARDKDLLNVEHETAALRSELTTALTQYKQEDAQVRVELQALRNRTLETAKKTFSMHKDSKSSSSKQHKQELLKALQAM